MAEGLRFLAQMSDENAHLLTQESTNLDSGQDEQAMMKVTPTTDHDYLEGAGGKQQHEPRLDIVNVMTTPAVPVGPTVAVSSSPLTPLQNQPKDANDVADVKLDKPWNKIGTWTSTYKGCFTTNEELEQVIKLYTEGTDSRWVVSSKDRLFGSTDIKLSRFKLFWRARGQEDDRKAAFPDYDGIPFIMVGRKFWGCHLGRDKCRSGKIKYRTKMQEKSQESESSNWPITRSSKKLGCPAVISTVHVLKFHEYPISQSMTEFRRKQLLKRLRQSLLSKHSIVKAEQRFYVHLAQPDEHLHDRVSSKGLQDGACYAMSGKVERSFVYRITELHHAGMFRLCEVSRMLDSYRKELYKDEEPPSQDLVPELYPNHNLIHYVISHAVKVTALLEMDLGHGHRLVSGWQADHPDDSWYYQPFASSGPIRRAKNKQDRLLAGHYPDLSQTFLFCCQRAAQRRLLAAYGTVCLLDSPRGKTLMPTYFLQVRTHAGYQLVGTVLMQYWSSQALVDALQVVRDWNPDWQPQAMLVDLIEEEVEALQKLFPECNFYISSVHRELAWLDYLNAGEGEDRSSDSALLDSLVYARTEEELSEALTKLRESPLWAENHRLRHWMTVRWLPHIKMWSYAFISKEILVTMCANEGLTRLREALIYDWLGSVRSRTLSELLTSLVMEEMPKLYDSYCEENQTMATSNRYQYCTGLPVYIRHQPVPARAHINELISSLPSMKVNQQGEGQFLVRREDNDFEHSVYFGSETEYPSCDCWAWLTGLDICEHFCAVFKECADWHWCQLSPLYTGNLIFALDSAILEVLPREVPRCSGSGGGSHGSQNNPVEYGECVQVSMDDFGAQEVLGMEASESEGEEDTGSLVGSTWQLDRKQTTCKQLLDQLSHLTEQTKDPEDVDYMTNNLLLLLRQMQGKRNDASPTRQTRGRKRQRSGKAK
ncbi:uncharacterized protein LOC110983427 [Acanthaster planci]|uniref:Uncharacterized protein LOC110983427 n=1 Tax=Acanthaster planci TaxID=133434 RepID=A0A8B7Z084_ACAPL|nr:uncharacterized protein LOC110983427 [Acanthaster planci]